MFLKSDFNQTPIQHSTEIIRKQIMQTTTIQSKLPRFFTRAILRPKRWIIDVACIAPDLYFHGTPVFRFPYSGWWDAAVHTRSSRVMPPPTQQKHQTQKKSSFTQEKKWPCRVCLGDLDYTLINRAKRDSLKCRADFSTKLGDFVRLSFPVQ